MQRVSLSSGKTFADILHELRMSKGVLQKQIALTLHVSQGAVSLWLAGKRTPRSKTTVLSLAEYLEAGERTGELLTAAGFGPPPPSPLTVVSRLIGFLQSPQFSDRSKAELSGLVRDLITVFELREMVLEGTPSDERPVLQEIVRVLTTLSPDRRSKVIAGMQQLIEVIS